jgi:hypothetical protein
VSAGDSGARSDEDRTLLLPDRSSYLEVSGSLCGLSTSLSITRQLRSSREANDLAMRQTAQKQLQRSQRPRYETDSSEAAAEKPTTSL